ncbi:sporulation protein [Bacillus sp. AGMB 02131]|uniref:Sporulation protein n=1 Tax=Peribacillus faecalis TaxID=2772559 RepID=A0A927CXP4_9BACI|nr:sporulation membrane protein YtrI [Peribacillus faecalis]MBD3109638.1 sporulation protein [Peribacillus faecalis]
MRPPTLAKDKGWQRFFAGVLIGAIVGWLVFFYMYSKMQEDLTQDIIEQKQEISSLKDKIAIWEKESESLNEEAEKKMTIQDIQVTIENYRQYDLDLLSVLQAQEAIRKDLSSLITKDLETVYKGKFLIKKTIENKIIEMNEKKYTFEVTELMFYSTIFIEVKVKRL